MIHTTKEGWRLEIKAFVDPTRRVYVSTTRDGACVVNGVAYNVNAHLVPSCVPGRWKLDTGDSGSVGRIYMSRVEWRGKTDDWTWPARRKLEARLIEIVEEWVNLWHGEFDLARREYRAEQIEKRETKIAELTEEINKLRAELTAFQETVP